MISKILRAYCEAYDTDTLFSNSGIARKAGHVQRVRQFIVDYPNLFLTPEMNYELAVIVAQHHDDGRYLQYQQTQKLDDSLFSHEQAGVQMLNNFCLSLGLSLEALPEDVCILKDVMQYHSKLEHTDRSTISTASIPYIKAVEAADSLDNSMSCVSYLKINYYGDEKGLSYEHHISDEVWNFYQSGTKFNKIKFCKTYDEYILFAGMLAIHSLKKYGKLAQTLFKSPGFGYPSILEGFREIFSELLLEDDAERAYKIMSGYVN